VIAAFCGFGAGDHDAQRMASGLVALNAARHCQRGLGVVRNTPQRAVVELRRDSLDEVCSDGHEKVAPAF